MILNHFKTKKKTDGSLEKSIIEKIKKINVNKKY